MLSSLIDSNTLPFIFAFFMSFAILMYTILDGYDLGVGLLIKNASSQEKDTMIASIGPFWDANETWLILGVGLVLVAFPTASSIILKKLYLPITVMLAGLMLRGVAFDLRMKAPPHKKGWWDNIFFYGSMLASLSQGFMLGQYIIGFNQNLSGILFSAFISVFVTTAYSLMGASWLIMKCEENLQDKAISWAKYYLTRSAFALCMVSVGTPFLIESIYEKWFSFPTFYALAPLPVLTGLLIIFLHTLLRRMPLSKDRFCYVPFSITVAIYILSFAGLAYSIFPYIIPEKMLITEAASAPESLMVIFFGVVFTLPFLIFYTALSYYIFTGKASSLKYD